MVSFRVVKSRIRAVLKRDHLDKRLDEELQTHIDMLVEEEMGRDVPEPEARRMARLRLGGLDQTKELVSDARAFWLESSWRDLRHAWRRVCAAPFFSLFAVITLAVGIGATTAIYSIIHSVLGPPSGVPNIESIINVYHWPRGNPQILGLSYGDYLDLRSQQTVFQDVTAWGFFRQSFTANGQAETSFCEIVDGDYFRLLGVNAQLGRTLQPTDAVPGAPPVVVISNGVWQRMFGSSPEALGQSLKINGRSFEIVGVAPPAFSGLFNGGLVPSALWVPLSSAPLFPKTLLGTLDSNERSQRWLMVKGRLKPGRTIAEASTELKTIAARLDAAYPIGRNLEPGRRFPGNVNRPWSVRRAAEIRINEDIDVFIGPIAWTVMVGVILVLLVACTNIANLMLARASGRRHELAVRLALGASKWSLIRGLLAESCILAGAGGIVGYGIARSLLVLLGNDLVVVGGTSLRVVPRLDISVIVVSALTTVLVLIVAGLAPALQATHTDLRAALATDGFHGARPLWRGRRILIAGQVAVSVILLSVMALCVSEIRQQSRIAPGFALERLALAEVDFGTQGYDETRVRQIVRAVFDQMRHRPDVDAVSVSSGLPVGLTTPGCGVGKLGQAPDLYAELIAGTPSIFQTLGLSVKFGRAFNDGDTGRSEAVIVINEMIARKLFGETNVIGRQLSLQRRQWVGDQKQPVEVLRVIGVVADSDATQISRREAGAVYLPFDQHYEGWLVFSLRAHQNPANLVGPVRQFLRTVEPEAAVRQAGTGLEIAGPSNLYLQLMAELAGTLGSFALALALAGLYGVLSHVVALRTWEVGVRMALGARQSEIICMVLRDGLRPVLFGIIVGIGVGTMARMLVRPLFANIFLPQQSAFALISVPFLMLIAGLVACYLPAQRAARINPNVALREL
jgi:predicted permease